MSRSAAGRAVRVYCRSEQMADKAFRALRGVFDGLWLGLLSREQLASIDKLYYDADRMYSQESYNRRGLFAWEEAAVSRHFEGVQRIVVTSAGGGREVLALAKAGFEVQGFEPHAELARIGNEILRMDGLDAAIEVSQRDTWPSAAEKADAVVVGWSGYMLTAGRDRRIAFLRDVAAFLPVGAPVLLSFMTVEEHDAWLRVTARVAATVRRLRSAEPVALGDALVPNLVHFFTRDELTAELDAGGFNVVDFGTNEYGWAVGQVRPKWQQGDKADG